MTAVIDSPLGCVDADDFSQLVHDYRGAVRATLRSMLRNPDDVADAEQEVFTRAYVGLGRLRDPARTRAWFLGIARHVATDQLRRQYRRLYTDAEALEHTPSNETGPEESFELAELVRSLRDGVASLSPRDAVVLTLSVQLGFSIEAIACALGISNGAAKVALHRARRRLRQLTCDAVA